MALKRERGAVAIAGAAAGFFYPGLRSFGQTAVNVSVNANSPITYADGAAIATMPATGLGLCTSVYANMWGDPNLPGDIAASGIQMSRYPGGSYADIYNWSLNTANEGGYVGPDANIGNFFNVINAAGTQAMITVNYGSNTTDTMGAQPQEAAAEVAYADAQPGIYGTNSDVNLGNDAAGVDWYTAGYWARLRASTPAEYEQWATAAGDYNPAYSFLAIDHPQPENIQYWEIGNEIGGNGYYGDQWEYDLHAPYYEGNTNSNVGRYMNPALSPTAYAQNLVQFATLMKQVDPNIKIGAGFDAEANSTNDAAILQTAGNYIDFGIIHWYPTGSLPSMITSTLPQEIANLRTSVANNTDKGYNGIEIDVTEFGDGNSSPPTIENALFAADAYATGFENGLQNMNFQEMSSSHYLNGNGTAGNPGEVYYAIQMVSKFASTGDTFVSTTSSNSSLRIHAVTNPDGTVSLLLINDGTTSADNVTVSLNDTVPVGGSGTLYLFGNSNIGTTDTPPSTQTLTNLGPSFSLSIPAETIGTLVIPEGNIYWDNAGGSGDGVTWNSVSQNWLEGSEPLSFTPGVAVAFTDTNNGHYGVSLTATVSPASVLVNNSLGNYTISGPGFIAGTGSLTKSGSASLTLSTVNTYTGGTVVNAGALIVGANGALPNASVTINGGTLRLGNGTGTASVSSLSISGNGTLDITNNQLLIDYGNGPDPMATIISYIHSGWNSNWGSSGIIFSSPEVVNGHEYGIGWSDGKDGVVSGLSSGQIELKYTLLGDANLDGTVNGSDFSILAANFGLGVTNWDQGNFLFSSSVNGSDFSALAANFGQGDSGADVSISQADIAAVDAFATANGLPLPTIAAVPEPASTGALSAIAGVLVLRRRRANFQNLIYNFL